MIEKVVVVLLYSEKYRNFVNIKAVVSQFPFPTFKLRHYLFANLSHSVVYFVYVECSENDVS